MNTVVPEARRLSWPQVGLISLAVLGGVFVWMALAHAAWCAFTWRLFTLFDYGVYTNMIWNSGHGRPFRMLLDFSYLRTHLSFTLALLGPLYRVWDHPFVLWVTQWIAMAVGAIVLWRTGRRHGLRPDLAVAVAAFVLVHHYSQAVALTEFHGVDLYLLLVPWLYHALCFRKAMVIWPLALILGLREDAFLLVTPLLLYFAVRDRWRAGYAYAALALAYGVLALFCLYPWFAGISLFARRARELGGWDFGRLLGEKALMARLSALWWVLLPTWPLWGRRGWLPIMLFLLAPLLQNLGSDYRPQYSLLLHYPAPVMACLGPALVEALRQRLDAPGGERLSFHGTMIVWYLAASLALMHLVRGFSPEDSKRLLTLTAVPAAVAAYAFSRCPCVIWDALRSRRDHPGCLQLRHKLLILLLFSVLALVLVRWTVRFRVHDVELLARHMPLWRTLVLGAAAAVCAVDRLVALLRRWLPQWTDRVARAFAPAAGMGVSFHLLLAALLSHAAAGYAPWGGMRAETRPYYTTANLHGVRAVRAARHIPREGRLMCDWQLAGYCANRADLIAWRKYAPERHGFDLVFGELQDFRGKYGAEYQRLVSGDEFGAIYFDGEFFILQRGADSARNREIVQALSDQDVSVVMYKTARHRGGERMAADGRIFRYWDGSRPGITVAYGVGLPLPAGRYEARLVYRAEPPRGRSGEAAGWGVFSAHRLHEPAALASAAIPPRAGRQTCVIRFVLEEETVVEPRVIGGAAALWLDVCRFRPVADEAFGVPEAERNENTAPEPSAHEPL